MANSYNSSAVAGPARGSRPRYRAEDCSAITRELTLREIGCKCTFDTTTHGMIGPILTRIRRNTPRRVMIEIRVLDNDHVGR